MIEQNPPTNVARPVTRAGGTSGARQLAPPLPPRRSRGVIFLSVIGLLMVGLAVVWSFVAQRQMATSLATDGTAEGTQHLTAAHKAFVHARTRTQAELQGFCRVMVEDPRLKATLATEGMDAATVADILQDLGKLRGSGFLMVLSPEGKVFAEAGAPELRGLDLAESSVVKKAETSAEAVVGSWVLGTKVMDLSTMAIRYGEHIVAYLVVGQSVDQSIVSAIGEHTDTLVASALAKTIVTSSSSEASVNRVLEQVAADSSAFVGKVMVLDGHRYVTAIVDLGETAQAHRLVLARPLAIAQPAFEPLRWMLFVPPLLVLVAVLFSLFGIRSFRRT